MKKKLLTMAVSAAVSLSVFCIPAFAGQWLSDANGWYYMDDDGTYPINTWRWIDGNFDGQEECYYFDDKGYCLINTMTPDGYYVNGIGAWTVDGDVQKQEHQNDVPAGNGNALPNPEGGMPNDFRPEMDEPQRDDFHPEKDESLHDDFRPETNDREQHTSRGESNSQSSSSGQPRACLDDMTPDYTNYSSYKNGLEREYISGGEDWQGAIVYGTGNGNNHVTKDYYLGGQYNTLTFEAVPWAESGLSFASGVTASLTISDQDTGRVLYSKEDIMADTKKFSATVDVSGVQYLRIETRNDLKDGWVGHQSYILIKDQYLY